MIWTILALILFGFAYHPLWFIAGIGVLIYGWNAANA